jgi:hypothetical protein
MLLSISHVAVFFSISFLPSYPCSSEGKKASHPSVWHVTFVSRMSLETSRALQKSIVSRINNANATFGVINAQLETLLCHAVISPSPADGSLPKRHCRVGSCFGGGV